MSSRKSSHRMSINDVQLPPNLTKDLSLQTLKELDKQNDATFLEYFEGLNLDEVKKVRERMQRIREGNRDIAAQNLELEPKLEAKKDVLLERCKELNQLREDYDKKYLDLKAIEGKKSHHAVEKELQQASRQTERESEDLAADFIGGKSSLNLDEFSEEFVKKRMLFWLRKVKAEKMKELLANYRPTPMPRPSMPMSPGNSFPSPTGSYPPTQHYSEPTSSLPPYPQNPSGMPNPHSSMGPRSAFPVASFASVPASMPTRPPPYTGSRINQHRY